MTNQLRKPIFTFIGAVCSIILLAGCIVHVGAGEAGEDGYASSSSWSEGKNYSEVNKSINIGDGQSVGNVSTVNGSLSMGDSVTADKVSSVNGRLSVGENANVRELSTVNGSLKVGEGLRTKNDVSTVNGSIKLRNDSEVGGTISTVNGSITLDGVRVEKNIETVNGSITLSENSLVNGDIVYRWNKNNYNSHTRKPPVLKIDGSSSVEGQIILEQEVELDFADKSLMDKVVERFDK